MFKELRPNAPFYIFDKGENTNLKIGSVLTVGQPVVKPQNNFNNGYQYQQPEYTVDIVVKIGDEKLNFNQLPANSTIADFSLSAANGQKIVISANRDLIKTEIESTMLNSQSILDSIEKHKSTITECEKILKEINPSFAKELEQEKHIKDLEKKISNLEGGIEDIKKLLTSKK